MQKQKISAGMQTQINHTALNDRGTLVADVRYDAYERSGFHNAIVVWNRHSGSTFGMLLRVDSIITTICFTPDKRIAFGCKDGSLFLWKPLKKHDQFCSSEHLTPIAPVQASNYRDHSHAITALTGSATGGVIWTHNEALHYANCKKKQPPIVQKILALKECTSLALTPDQQTIVATCLHDTQPTTVLLDEDIPHKDLLIFGDACSSHLSTDGTTILIGRRNGSIDVYGRSSMELLRSIDAHNKGITQVGYILGERCIASACGLEATVKIWEAATGNLLHTQSEKCAPFLSAAIHSKESFICHPLNASLLISDASSLTTTST